MVPVSIAAECQPASSLSGTRQRPRQSVIGPGHLLRPRHRVLSVIGASLTSVASSSSGVASVTAVSCRGGYTAGPRRHSCRYCAAAAAYGIQRTISISGRVRCRGWVMTLDDYVRWLFSQTVLCCVCHWISALFYEHVTRPGAFHVRDKIGITTSDSDIYFRTDFDYQSW
ncbi:hypothetical protein FJT64_001662 [Amphibalanus amphitrite]|uniref:Uncharacterized protein n=1 Tax=Amphibalanus amphitrite TaxID=1232801 RepID=A0A6A4XDS1_AMPAM|nr:hypothetical protein FJT64_001662 [Amphibalanus amphitrite]